jgi:hypothetical protein
MLLCPMLALSKSEGFTLSLEGLYFYPEQCRRAQTSLSPDPHPHFSTLPLTSVNSVPSALGSPFSGPTTHSPARDSSPSPIPFRMIFLAHPYHLTPIESYSCKKQGRGYARLRHSPSFPLSTASSHAPPSNVRKSFLFMGLLHDPLDTWGWGVTPPKPVASVSAKNVSLLHYLLFSFRLLASHGTNPPLPRLHRCRGELHA